MTIEQAAALAETSTRNLERWVKAGIFPKATAKDGRARLWSAAEVRAWVIGRPAYAIEPGPFHGSRMCTPLERLGAYLIHSELVAGVDIPGARLRVVDDPGYRDAVLVEVDAQDGAHVVALGVKGWRPKLPGGSWAPLPPIKKIHGFTFKLKGKRGDS